ncbi:group II trans-sialidase superfamily [Trypanosoma rangeli]|uniref:Group II trans-sialidase superfamily n=1 Tax=Trypanosoma rangeli TaxID=5698 RepID=A0A422N839_TRYRA|nr:group II trans-sialidase superfamily [Trypanosoma rangeli]RNF01621.1 group II trans-sialidase superfamily [Trypanosoma rangeli]|eukprot:RNF01621.1 group II trans-sialidase superfamily [Trypanosoma rangeli]
MLNMSQHMFYFSVQLLCVLLICFGSTAVHAEEGNTPKEAQTPDPVDLFVPNRTIVETQGESQTRDSFVSPSLTSAGGVLVALARGHRSFKYSTGDRISVDYADVVAGYIDPTESWSSFIDEVNTNKWKSHNIFSMSVQVEHKPYVRCVLKPTTVAKGSKVFLLVGGHYLKFDPSSKSWIVLLQGLDLLVGEATQDKLIQWGKPTSLLSQIEPSAEQRGLDRFAGGGSGVVMEDGTFVFPLTARDALADTVSMIIYSKNDDKNWVLSQGMLPVGCTDPLIVEWEQGQLLMIAQCKFGPNVFESRDMGATWTEAGWTLTGLQPRFSSDFLQRDWSVTSFTTATIAGEKVMLYTQKEVPPGERAAKALYLWVADNNRTFYLGPISMDTAEKWMSANTLLHSNDALHLLQEWDSTATKGVSLAPLTEELKTITSVLETWAKVDSSLSKSSVPTAGLVGFLSGASGDGTWNDAYRCLNAIVTNAKRAENGFKFMGSESYAMWPVNMWKYHYVGSFVSYAFTLVATVTIHEVPKESAPLLGAGLEDNENTKFVGLSYTTEKRWGTVFNGITTTTHNSTWKPGKEYQVALMLQDNKGSVYVDGVLVGNTNTLPTLRSRRHDISHFYFGGGKDSSVTVKNVFLYNRQLSEDELKAGDDSHASEQPAGDSSTRADVFWVSMLLLILLLGLWGFGALC